MDVVPDYHGSGMEVVRITLHPESEAEKYIGRAISTGVPPEGNIIGWALGTKVVLEVQEV